MSMTFRLKKPPMFEIKLEIVMALTIIVLRACDCANFMFSAPKE